MDDGLDELSRLVYDMIRYLKDFAESMKRKRRYRDARILSHLASSLSDSFSSFESAVKFSNVVDMIRCYGYLIASLAETRFYGIDELSDLRERIESLALQIIARKIYEITSYIDDRCLSDGEFVERD